MARGQSPLVGRSQEIQTLRDSAAQARSGQRATVLVDGPAGIGKSRLVSEAIARVREPDDLVIPGHGVELSGGELPYGTISETLGNLVREDGVAAVREKAGEAASTLAALCPQLGGNGEAVETLRLFAGYVSMLERLATGRLVWLVIEDLHWADASSRDLVRYLVRAAGPCRLLIVVTVRTHDPSTDPGGSELASEWAATTDVQRLTVPPLSRDEVGQQVMGLATTPPSDAFIDRVATLSQGVPFLIEELMTAGLTTTGAVPASVLELMMARVRRLEPNTRRLVQLASLAEGHLQHRLLEQVYAYDQDTVSGINLASAIAGAVDARVLRFDSVEHSYSFVHALLRQAVEATVQPSDRLHWHRTWAILLSGSYEQIPDARSLVAAAHHWTEAGAEIEAFDASVAAARHADRLGALAELATLLSRVLRLWDRVPDATRRAGRSRDAVLSDAILVVGFGKGADDVIALLEGELTRAQIGDHDPLSVLCLRLTLSCVQQLEDSDERLYAEALASTDGLLSAEPNPLLVHGLHELGFYVFDSEPDLSFRLHSAALSAADRLNDRRLQRFAGAAVAGQLGCQGRIEEAITECDRLLQDRVDSLDGLIELSSERGLWLYHAGRYREARSFLRDTLSRVSDPEIAGLYWAIATMTLCDVLFALGEWDMEQSLLEQIDLHRPQVPEMIIDLAETAGQLAVGRGDTTAASRWVETARANLPPDEEGVWMAMRKAPRFLAAQTAIASGDLLAARDELAPLWRANGCGRVADMWQPLMLAAEIEADLAGTTGRRTDSDGAALAVLRSIASELPPVGDLGLAWSAHLEADLARASGHDDPEAWVGVVETWRTVGHVPYLTSALMRLAAAHLAAGDRDAAAGPLVDSFRIASDLGAQPLRHRIIELAHHGHLRLDADTDSQRMPETERIARLTPREVEVLRLVAQGMSNNEIAQKLFISPKTASVHVSRILTKLSVNSRAKATAIAYEEQILTDTN